MAERRRSGARGAGISELAGAIGRAIRVIRTGRGFGRKELAKRAGLSYSYLAEIETGAKAPSSRALQALAESLGLPLSELVETAETWARDHPEAPRDRLDERLAFADDSTVSDPRDVLREEARSPRRRWFHAPQTLRSKVASREIQESDFEGEGTSLDVDLRDLEELLGGLSPQDRKRVLDLARRLTRR